MKPFVPFDSFEKCDDTGKPLKETMQENCNERFNETEESDATLCIPFWQLTGEKRCLDINVLEVEEANGCGQTRFRRVVDPVIWTDTGETRCNTEINRFEKEQVNQCGDSRWQVTNTMCCDPTWISTGEVRCEPGNIYQVEQTNECGQTRWQTIPGGCPCIPDWQPTGPERCTGANVEREEIDGCGHTRWQSTGTPVNWDDTDETRCNGSFIQIRQINQCGGLRWFTTETACTNSPQPNELNADLDNDGEWSSAGSTTLHITLNVSNGKVGWNWRDVYHEANWVDSAFNRQDYEARVSVVAGDQPSSPHKMYTGPTLDTWYNLGDISVFSPAFKSDKAAQPGNYNWLATFRIDIRKVGEPISGGITFGPLNLRAT